MAGESLRTRDQRRLKAVERARELLGPRAQLESVDREVLRVLIDVVEELVREEAKR